MGRLRPRVGKGHREQEANWEPEPGRMEGSSAVPDMSMGFSSVTNPLTLLGNHPLSLWSQVAWVKLAPGVANQNCEFPWQR